MNGAGTPGTGLQIGQGLHVARLPWLKASVACKQARQHAASGPQRKGSGSY